MCDEDEGQTKFVEIKVGVDEDGGGVQITIRDDTADISQLVELSLKIYEKIAGSKPKTTDVGVI